MPDKWLRALAAFERELVHYDVPAPEGAAGLAALQGRRPVLISAPHATCHLRAQVWKRQDEYTGAIAHWLHHHAGAYALYPTHRIAPDPHDDDDQGAYKQTLREFVQAHDIRLVLDLHGARPDRDFALALGTIHGRTCSLFEDTIIAAFEAFGFRTEPAPSSLDRLAVNLARFAGGTSLPTVTRFAWDALGVPAMQIEINARARVVDWPSSPTPQQGITPSVYGEPDRIKRVLAALVRVVESV